MRTTQGERWAPRQSWGAWLKRVGAGAMLAALAGLLPLPAGAAAESKFTPEDLACLKCHDAKTAKEPLPPKKMEDGKLLPMDFPTREFIESRHNGTACEDCHTGMDLKTHGKEKTPLASKRKLSESMQETCRDCHKKRFKEFEDSVHAALLKSGSDKAPLCSSCHEPHLQPDVKIVQPLDKVPCAQCHKDIFKAYAKDVHGLERVKKGKEAPICGDCHKTHDIKAASLGDQQKDACLKCHKKAEAEHKEWLPNAPLHFAAISCPTCHAPDAKRRVNLRLYDEATSQQQREKVGVPTFVQRTKAADATNQGLDAGDIDKLLADYTRDTGGKGHMVLRGRLEVAEGVQAHQLAEKEKAIKDCATCHKQGAQPFQSVVLSVAGPDGRALRHGVQSDVLSSPTALDSVRGFYAIGATRMKLLDWLLVLVVLGAAAVPLGHMALGAYLRRRQPGSAHPAQH